MTQWSAGTNDSVSRGRAVLEIFIIQQDPANNRTLIRHAGGAFDNNGSYGGYGTGWYSLWLNGGLENNSSVYYDFAGDTPGWVQIHDHWIYHNEYGQATVSGRMEFGGDGSPVGYADTGTQYFTLPDYSRPPSAPSAPSLARASSGGVVTVTSAVASSPVGISDYHYRYSTDNTNWSGAVSMGTDRVADFNGVSTQTYYFQTRATSSEGDGGWSGSSGIVGVPTAPASCTVALSGRSILVTAGSSTGDGINGYWVQYSTDGGSTWSTAQVISSQQYQYTNLAPALTYLFRVYSTNGIGYSASTVSSGTFIPAGGKRSTGSAWQSTTIAKRGTGTDWVDMSIAKRSDGVNWVDQT